MDAVIYARVSTTDQETGRQINELKEHAKILGLNVVQVFAEKISGTTKQSSRPSFSALQDYIKLNGIKHIICHELSRIGRNLRHTVDIIYDLMDEGVCIHTKSENIRTLNPDGTKNNDALFRVGIFGSISQMEIETMRVRVKSGLRNSKMNGGANGAVQPYGFQSIDRKLAIHPEEAKVVQEIYNLYLSGHSMVKIAQHLNDLGVRTKKAKRWVDKPVNDILKNTIYKGDRFHKGEKVPYDLEILIPYEKWEAVQKMIKGKADHHNRDSKNINILKGLIFCGVCGEPLYMHRRRDLSDNVYKCLSTKTGYKTKSCGLKGINVDLLNQFALMHLIAAGTMDWSKLKGKLAKQNIELKNKIQNMEDRIKQKNTELSKLTTGYIKGIIKEKIFIDQSEAIEKELKDTELRVLSYKDQLQVVPDQPKEFGSDLSVENFIGEFKKCISRIEVSNIPLENTPFNQRKDNIAYKLKAIIWGFDEVISYVSSRDKRLFDSQWKYSGIDLSKVKKIML